MKTAAEVLALAGGLLMLVVASLVTISVLMRWLGGICMSAQQPGAAWSLLRGPVCWPMQWLPSSGISGDFELVQIATALGAFAFLPLCQARRGNVIVDTFTNRLSPRARDRLDGLWDLTYAALIAILSWRLVLGARDAFASQTTSMVLGIPQGYAIAACAAMGVFLAVVAVATAIPLLKGRP